MVIITAIFVLGLSSLKSFELIILLFITDFIVLWTQIESNKGENGKNILAEKIENLEKLISDVFNKMTKKPMNEKEEKKEIIEWLNKF
jgi:hypothetical protein